MGAHQQGDRLIIVVELGFHARQIVKRIHIIRAFTERGLKHPLGALVVASVKGGKAQVIEDVEVRGFLIEGARQGLLRLRVLFPSRLNHSYRKGHSRVALALLLHPAQQIFRLGGFPLCMERPGFEQFDGRFAPHLFRQRIEIAQR